MIKPFNALCFFTFFALSLSAFGSSTEDVNSYERTKHGLVTSPLPKSQLNLRKNVYDNYSYLRLQATQHIDSYRQHDEDSFRTCLFSVYRLCDYLAEFRDVLQPGWQSYDGYAKHHSDFEWKAIALNQETSIDDFLSLFESMVWLSFYRELFYQSSDEGEYLLKNQYSDMPDNYQVYVDSIPNGDKKRYEGEFFNPEDFTSWLRHDHNPPHTLTTFLFQRLANPSEHHGDRLVAFYRTGLTTVADPLNAYVDSSPNKRRLADAFSTTAENFAQTQNWSTVQSLLQHRHAILQAWFDEVLHTLNKTKREGERRALSHEMGELLMLLPRTTLEMVCAYCVLEKYDPAIEALEKEIVAHQERLDATGLAPSGKVLSELYEDLLRLSFVANDHLKIKDLYYTLKESKSLSVLTEDARYIILGSFADVIEDLQQQEHVLWKQSSALKREAKSLYETLPKPGCYDQLRRLFHTYIW